MILHILHLYPYEMNIYGDRGNLLALQRRAAWHGLEPVMHYHHPGLELPEPVHLVLGGGGQDSAQDQVQNDVLRIGDELHGLAEAGVPMLMICGMYQLLCHRFITQQDKKIRGIGVFDAETIAESRRFVGNIKVDSELGVLYGFENHSGRTILNVGQAPLGTVLRGNGNNGQDRTEGARTSNVFGTYLHGPVLPNNPRLADELITLAARNVSPDFAPRRIDDHLADLARAGAARRRY
jgi:CobQ-like glutamine amidotransferase family enzyme